MSMAEVTAPVRPSNVERFPVIGKHLIDEATPAYAPTRPPEPVRDDAAPVIRYSRWSPIANALLIALAFLWSRIRRD